MVERYIKIKNDTYHIKYFDGSYKENNKYHFLINSRNFTIEFNQTFVDNFSSFLNCINQTDDRIFTCFDVDRELKNAKHEDSLYQH